MPHRVGCSVASSWTREQICVPCIARQIFNSWTTREFKDSCCWAALPRFGIVLSFLHCGWIPYHLSHWWSHYICTYMYIHIYVYVHTYIYMLYLYKHSNRYVMVSHCGFSVHFLVTHNAECHFIYVFVILIAPFWEKALAPHFSIPWTEKAWCQAAVHAVRVRHDWSDLAAAA